MAKKQLEIPGTERPSIKEIEEAAEVYVDARDKRMRMLEKEIAAKANLLTVLLAHEGELETDGEGNRVYSYDEEIVILKPGKRNVKVRALKEAEDNDDED